ncbi:unnamed protein product [Lepeophtheirus salmonis]|uniref:(salmon louse) hypothetical protein n=1 Tax=Lepeophtheirus salmonis TaxID=72036 RepID=A0A7R8H6V1_LEPSM|nr:unnamed protein product [Lepeophtheirus salmonis]CAF2910673.1 unnamed protein product [Lepeophtheirus salmonis]
MGTSRHHHPRSSYHPSSNSNHHRTSPSQRSSSTRRRSHHHPASPPRRESSSNNPALLKRRASVLDYRHHRHLSRQNDSTTSSRSGLSRRKVSPDTLPDNNHQNEPQSNSSRIDQSDLRSQISKSRLDESLSYYYSSNDEDMNLEKELYPLGHYINNRAEMIEHIFSIIKEQKLNGMLTSNLKELSLEELKESCLIQLEGMSKQRIRCILAGQEMEESSNTEEEEEEDDRSSNHQDELCNKSDHDVDENRPVDGIVLGDDEIVERKEDHKKVVVDDKKETHPFLLPKRKKVETPSEEESKRDDNRNSKIISTSLKKIDVNISKKSKSALEEGTAPPQGEKSKMELLELEMRARAIKALLGKNEKCGEIKINLNTEEHIEEENEDTKKIRKEESLKRRKAREVLELSEAKKRDEEEKREAEEAKKKQEEGERLQIKKKKEEEHAKFLKWKQDKLFREEELKRQNKLNDEGKIKHSVKRNLDNLRRQDEDTLASRKRSASEKLVKRGHDKNKYRKKNVHTSSDEEQQDSERSKKLHQHSNKVEQHPQKAEEDVHSPVSSDDEELLKKERKTRAERVAEIRRQKRKVKRASDIEDGEVDTDDDSDKEKVLSSSENEDVNEKQRNSKKKNSTKRNPKLRKKLVDRKSEDNESELEIEKETEDERKAQCKHSNKERKFKSKSLLRRIVMLPKKELKRRVMRNPIFKKSPSLRNLEIIVFYQSYIEDKERKEIKDSPDKEKSEIPLQTPPPPPPPAKKPLTKIDGVAQVAKLCESQGDFDSQPPPLSTVSKKEKQCVDKTREEKSLEKNKMDQEQEELDNQTWADRWYQDKTVLKVVKESKTYSKVRNNIKMKIDSKKEPPKDMDPERLNEEAAHLPDVSTVGSIQQYAKITGKTLEDIDKSRVDPENPKLSDLDDEISLGGGDEDLWGDIMGTHNESD